MAIPLAFIPHVAKRDKQCGTSSCTRSPLFPIRSRAATLARQRAEAELAELYREREIARARAAEHDPALPLQ
jgi:hypothetical protein